MIGILCEDKERDIVREFFQLFKTPWEFYARERFYDVVVSTCDETSNINAAVLVAYGSKERRCDLAEGITISSILNNILVNYEGIKLPIYGNVVTFRGSGDATITTLNSEPVGIKIDGGKSKIFRLGYDLFQEVAFLVSMGQPIENARILTLEIHIAMLRNWIVDAGIPLVEVPPVPMGYNFIACLTHDVDFVGIRKHKFDHTMWGFLYRASIGTFLSFLKGEYSLSRLIRNWKAVLSLPLIYLGCCDDIWLQFDRYLGIEKDLKSTFFLIPFKNLVGEKVLGRNPGRRATRYDITDVEGWAKELTVRGYEVGVHAIDAWHSYEKAVEEQKRISEVTGKTNLGVRTHWLYFNEYSQEILDEAGFCYDSTFGYNESVGYRAGTTQVFKPLSAKNLLELPLHIQDKALLNSERSRLTEEQAWRVCVDCFDQVSLYGGVVTILWHMRSLAPERCWDDFYVQLLKELKKRCAWVGSAGQVVEWFRKRRMLSFEDIYFSSNKLRLSLNFEADIPNPNFILRVYMPGLGTGSSHNHIDIAFPKEKRFEISF